jgi:hypothetical protein
VHSLRVTIRCLVDDFGLTPDHAERALDDLVSQHALIEAFRDQRSQLPIGAEYLRDLTSSIQAYTLHSTRWRGVTWHDREEAVVWLLAGRFHTSGHSDDAYPYFRKLDADDKLLPIRQDYGLLDRERAVDLVRALADDVPGECDNLHWPHCDGLKWPGAGCWLVWGL